VRSTGLSARADRGLRLFNSIERGIASRRAKHLDFR
jgi:hypothetical protein